LPTILGGPKRFPQSDPVSANGHSRRGRVAALAVPLEGGVLDADASSRTYSRVFWMSTHTGVGRPLKATRMPLHLEQEPDGATLPTPYMPLTVAPGLQLHRLFSKRSLGFSPPWSFYDHRLAGGGPDLPYSSPRPNQPLDHKALDEV